MKPVSAALFAAALVAVVLVCHAATLAAKAEPCLPGCKECEGVDPDKTCKECNEGFALSVDKKKCNPCEVKGCTKCDKDVKTCEKCTGDAAPVEEGKECPEEAAGSCPKNCEECKTGTDECIKCKEGFALSKDKKKCEACTVENCAKCDTDVAKCEKCKGDAEPLNEGKECPAGAAEPCLPHCKACEGEGVDKKCTECEDGFTLSADKKKCDSSDAALHAALLPLVSAVLTAGGVALSLGA